MDRRGLLQSGVALGAVGIAGCVGVLEDDSQGDETQRDGDETGGAETTGSSGDDGYELDRPIGRAVTDWLLPPETVGVDPYDVEAFTPGRLGAYRDEMPPDLTELADQMYFFLTGDRPNGGAWDPIALLATADYGYGNGATILARGSFDTDHLRWIVEGDDMISRDEHGGLQVYEADSAAAAFDGTTLVQTSADRPVETLERTIDAAAGDAPRYADERESFARLVAPLPDGDVFGVADGAPGVGLLGVEGAVAKSESFAVGGAETTATEAIRFEADADVTIERGESYLDAHRLRPAPDHESVDVTVDGQVVVIESEIDTADVPKVGAM